MKINKNIKLAYIIGMIIFSVPGYSQNDVVLTQTIRGQVVDKETQITLPAATVVLLDTNPVKATTTDNEGYSR